MQPAYWPKNALGASGNRRETIKCCRQTTAEFDSFSAMSALANLLMGGIAASSFDVELPEGRSLNVVHDMSHPFAVIHEDAIRSADTARNRDCTFEKTTGLLKLSDVSRGVRRLLDQ